jgi:hypothetical protein
LSSTGDWPARGIGVGRIIKPIAESEDRQRCGTVILDGMAASGGHLDEFRAAALEENVLRWRAWPFVPVERPFLRMDHQENFALLLVNMVAANFAGQHGRDMQIGDGFEKTMPIMVRRIAAAARVSLIGEPFDLGFQIGL